MCVSRRTLLLVAGVGLSRGVGVQLVSELHYTQEAKISKEMAGEAQQDRARARVQGFVCQVPQPVRTLDP